MITIIYLKLVYIIDQISLDGKGFVLIYAGKNKLFHGFPMLNLDKFERYPLTFGPTPIEHLPRLTKAIGGKVEIFAKRDDCNSGLAMGGNKLRKLEYIVPDAIASGADTLVSIGGVQSNHTRMVAATAAKIGMKCVVIQESWVPHDDAVYDRVGNIMMTRLMGADSRLVDEGFDIGIRKSWEDAMQSVRDSGGIPYAIPAGASVHKYGGLGYIGFAEEVREQEKQMGIKFDYIIVLDGKNRSFSDTFRWTNVMSNNS